MKTHFNNLAASFALFAAMVSCGRSAPVAPPVTTKPVAQAKNPAAPVKTVESPVTAPAADTESPVTERSAAEEKTIAADYQPPFPDRIHLFLAPKRVGKSSGAANDQEEAVELLGFVNVRDNRKAVLSINGLVYPVAEGDSQFGVEVISIQPPGVVLQRGRQRWQATLEN